MAALPGGDESLMIDLTIFQSTVNVGTYMRIKLRT